MEAPNSKHLGRYWSSIRVSRIHSIFSRFEGWFSGVERRALKLGEYSIAGLEDVCVVERKDLSDLVRSFTVERATFVTRLRQIAKYPHCLLVVTAALSQVKSPYPHSAVSPSLNNS